MDEMMERYVRRICEEFQRLNETLASIEEELIMMRRIMALVGKKIVANLEVSEGTEEEVEG